MEGKIRELSFLTLQLFFDSFGVVVSFIGQFLMAIIHLEIIFQFITGLLWCLFKFLFFCFLGMLHIWDSSCVRWKWESVLIRESLLQLFYVSLFLLLSDHSFRILVLIVIIGWGEFGVGEIFLISLSYSRCCQVALIHS